MFTTINWLGRAAAGMLIAAAAADLAYAQTCIEDQYGRVVCGRLVDPNRAPPRYQEPPDRDYQPPPAGEQQPPPRRDYPPPPREYDQPATREYGPPSGRDYVPPPPPRGREPSRDNFGRPPPRDETRYQPPVQGRNGEWFCPQRSDTIQDGLCKPYIGR